MFSDLKQPVLVRDGYLCWDDLAVELETAELLYSLTRAAKPALVVESGTGRGIAARYIAQALHTNGAGRLVTFEIHDVFHETARDILAGLPAEVRGGMSKTSGLNPDMVFIDCVSDLREGEIHHWLTHPGRPLVVVHDAKRPYDFTPAEGVYIPGHDGVWIGRPKAKEN